MKKYLVVGNGVAGTTAAEHIRINDPDGAIAIVTDEETPFYYRTRLPEFLGGNLAEPKLIARKDDWYRERDISL